MHFFNNNNPPQEEKCINIEIKLPPDYTSIIQYGVSKNATIQTIKTEIFRTTKTLQNENPDNFLLGIKEDDLLYVEFVKLLYSHHYIKTQMTKNQTITLLLVPKKEHILRSQIPNPNPTSQNASMSVINKDARNFNISQLNNKASSYKGNTGTARKVDTSKFQSQNFNAMAANNNNSNPHNVNPSVNSNLSPTSIPKSSSSINLQPPVNNNNNNRSNSNNSLSPNVSRLNMGQTPSNLGKQQLSPSQARNTANPATISAIPTLNTLDLRKDNNDGRKTTGYNSGTNSPRPSRAIFSQPVADSFKSMDIPSISVTPISSEIRSEEKTPLDHIYYQNLTSQLDGFPIQLKLENGLSFVVNYKINVKVDAFKDSLITHLQKLIDSLQRGNFCDSLSGKTFTGDDVVFPYCHTASLEQEVNNSKIPIIPVQKVYIKVDNNNNNGGSLKREPSAYTLPPQQSQQFESPLSPRKNDGYTSVYNDDKNEKLASLQIGSLIGRPLVWSKNDIESFHFRSTIAKELDFSTLSEMKAVDIIRTPSANCPIPSSIRENKYPIRFYFANKSSSKTVLCCPKDNIMNIVSNVITREEKRRVLSRSIADFVIKLYGSCEYIFENVPIGDIVPIRESLKRSRENIAFVLFPRYMLETELKIFFDREKHCLIEQNEDKEPEKEDAYKQFINIDDISKPFDIKLSSMEFDFENSAEITLPIDDNYLLECRLYHGMDQIAQPSFVKFSHKKSQPINQTFSFPILTCNIPKATRITIIVYADERVANERRNQIAWGNFNLVSFQSELKSGFHNIFLTTKPIHFYPMMTEKAKSYISIELPSYPLPALYTNNTIKSVPEKSLFPFATPKAIGLVPSSDEEMKLNLLFRKDPLYEFTQDEKAIIWKYREYYRSDPISIIPILHSVPWESRVAVKTVHTMLHEWAPLNPFHALTLLGPKFSDEKVRKFGVFCLKQLKNDELSLLMLQLVQSLKYEAHHDSTLSRFLIQRALFDCRLIGNSFFWNVQAELTHPVMSDRYTLLMESFLRGCGANYRSEFIAQMDLVKHLKNIAKTIQQTPAPKRTETLKKLLTTYNIPTSFIMPSNPQVRVSGIDLEKCKTKDSFTAPLWLVFKVQENEAFPFYFPVIFKLGDDLRQDSLTLQIIRLMDNYWKKDGLDLEMSPYNVTSVGDLSGFIEVVRDSKSLADIQKEAGGAAAVAFSKTPLFNWLRKHNPSDDKFEVAIHNFTYSCAGYSVASYLLGLADRHNDNILISRSGHLLHIDFAHFLGNFMTWKGIPRETAPFILTPEIAHVMGGVKSEQFQQFVALCCRAFNILRRHANSFLALFSLMIHSGLAQLNSYENIGYMRNAFMLELSDDEAAIAFTRLIDRCLSSIATRAMFVLHVLAHPDKGD